MKHIGVVAFIFLTGCAWSLPSSQDLQTLTGAGHTAAVTIRKVEAVGQKIYNFNQDVAQEAQKVEQIVPRVLTKFPDISDSDTLKADIGLLLFFVFLILMAREEKKRGE